MNKEKNISKHTANKIVKEYFNEYYNEMVNIKTKVKMEGNDLLIIVKKITKINNKNVVKTEILNEGKISNIIREYMAKEDCIVDNIIFEPYFHNLNIRYHGNEFELHNKKEMTKVLVA